MHPQPVRLQVLIESGVRLWWPQSVALIQGIVAAGRQARDARDGEPLADLALHPDGVVVVTSGNPPTVSVSELALLLGRLLPGEWASGRDRAPAGLQFAVARALGLAPAPPIGSVDEFSRLLARFETGDRAQLLREVFEHYLMYAMRAQARYAEELQACSSSEPASGPPAFPDDGPAVQEPRRRVERRRSGITPDVARRLLREADERHYRALSNSPRTQSRTPRTTQHQRRTALPVDMLRRVLREADRDAFDAWQSARTGNAAAGARRTLQRAALCRYAWHSGAVLLVLAILIAVGLLADGHRGRPAIPADIPMLRQVEGSVSGTPTTEHATRAETPTAGAVPEAPVVTPPPARAHGVAAKPAQATARRPAPVELKPARRSPPIRFLGAVRRGFLRLIHRQPASAATTAPAAQ